MGYIKRLTELFHETDAILYGHFNLVSGKESNYIIEAKRVLETYEGAGIVGRLVSEKILSLEREAGKQYQIAGVHRGGAMVAELAAGVLGREHVSLNYKTGEIAGNLHTKETIICEDVTTKASSITKCMREFMIPKGIPVRNTITVVDREEGAAENLLQKFDITHHFFITKTQLGITTD